MIAEKAGSAGVCPNCGDGLCYPGNSGEEGTQYYYEFKCQKCGCEGKEWYNMTFSCFTVEEDT